MVGGASIKVVVGLVSILCVYDTATDASPMTYDQIRGGRPVEKTSNTGLIVGLAIGMPVVVISGIALVYILCYRKHGCKHCMRRDSKQEVKSSDFTHEAAKDISVQLYTKPNRHKETSTNVNSNGAFNAGGPIHATEDYRRQMNIGSQPHKDRHVNGNLKHRDKFACPNLNGERDYNVTGHQSNVTHQPHSIGRCGRVETTINDNFRVNDQTNDECPPDSILHRDKVAENNAKTESNPTAACHNTDIW